MRYIVIDFETNGFASRGSDSYHAPLPWQNFPTQIAVFVVDHGAVEYAYDTLISGAAQLSLWVHRNVPLSLEEIDTGKPLEEVIRDLALIIKDDDVIVTHNTEYDMDEVLAKSARGLMIRGPELQRILSRPRLCTCKCSYSVSVFGKWPKLSDLCNHFGTVDFEDKHEAVHDAAALALCVAQAWRRGVMLPYI